MCDGYANYMYTARVVPISSIISKTVMGISCGIGIGNQQDGNMKMVKFSFKHTYDAHIAL